MKKVAYSIVSVVAAFTLIFSGCGEKEVSIDALIDSNDDYIGDRVRITGKLSGEEFTTDTGSVVIVIRENEQGRGIACYFPINEPPPPYLAYGDVVTISGIVRFNSLGWYLLVECRVVE